ncbi:MAG: serine/threonine protein kinase [Deltaproteobacteria bacterium]|nr:serine/threonine protein kinase [Deltaproteobacteria bacterium]
MFDAVDTADELSKDSSLSQDRTVDDGLLDERARSRIRAEMRTPAIVESKASDFDDLAGLLDQDAPRPAPERIAAPRPDTVEDPGLAATLIRLDPDGPERSGSGRAIPDRALHIPRVQGSSPKVDPSLLREAVPDLPAMVRAPLIARTDSELADTAGFGRSPMLANGDVTFDEFLPPASSPSDGQSVWPTPSEAPAPPEPPEPPAAFASPDMIGGKYRVTGVLGEGAMATVFAAEHLLLKHRVAVKVVHDSGSTLIERLRREAESLARVKHPGIVTIHDYDVMPDGRPFIIMERVDGGDLATRLEQGPLSISETVDLGLQVADALAAAHAEGVIHRDLKPANVLLSTSPRGTPQAKLVDFGAANVRDRRPLTIAGGIIGTPAYMAPEQVSGTNVDERTDVHALGLLLYEAATGRQPFQGERFEQCLAKVISHNPPPASTAGAASAELDGVLTRALAKAPSDRFATMGEFAAALRAAIVPRAESRSATQVPEPSVRARGPVPWYAWIGLGVIALLAAVIAALATK